MVILNNGCSFSAKSKIKYAKNGKGQQLLRKDKHSSPKKPKVRRNTDWYITSYCDYLPGEIHNIAKHGSGIDVTRTKRFLDEVDARWRKKNKQLTHYIYQIPHPTRQPIFEELKDDEEFYKATLQIDELWEISENAPKYTERALNHSTGYSERLTDVLRLLGRRFKRFGCGEKYMEGSWEEVQKTKYLQDNFLWHQLRHEHKIFGLETRERYLKKALNGVNENVNILRDKWPDVKIIFLRYEETKIPLVHEYAKDWFKNTLSEYCKDNNVTYIYEENFNTKWFKDKKLCDDKRHPNRAGAELIANKIKEYL
tara:strand:+ start:2465 stop:3397 length:933 start_codon:yes stop_codon:yes gene_type:complete